MFTDAFLDSLKSENVASIASWNGGEPHLAATWNSYIHKTEDGALLIPVLGMRTTQENVAGNNRVKMVIGSKDVMGKHGQGTGFLLEGTAKFIHEGELLDIIQKRFDWAESVLEVTVTKITQTE